MLQDHVSPNTLGADIRALRKARGMTLQDVADRLDRSVGWVSQIERDISDPSIDDLRDLARLFDVSVSMLFGQTGGPVAEAGRVVRAGARRKIGSADGLVEELLSPDLTDDFEMVHSVFQPGARSPGTVARPTQEVAYLVSGQLDLTIGGEAFTIQAGDSFRIREEGYSWANPYPEAAVAIWVIAPPVY